MMQETKSKFEKIQAPGLDFTLPSITGSDGGRVYTTPQGNHYPSASTISRILTRDGIAAWRARVGDAAADKKTKRGANRGTGVHLVCEKYMISGLSPMERAGMLPTTKELFLQIQRKLDKHVRQVYAIEQGLFSDRLRIAGRADAIATWDDEIAILDFKTAEKAKPEAWILNYFVQAAAYAEMFEERTGIRIQKLVILMALETEPHPVVYCKEKEGYLPILQQCIDTYYKENPIVG